MKKLILAFFFCLFFIKVSAAVIVQNGLTHIHEISQNGSTAGKVILKNIGSKDEQIKVYFYDLKTECSGNIVYNEPGSQSRTLNPYLKVSSTDYILKPGEEYELIYQIDLTKNNLNGSLWSIMMIEIVEPFSKNTKNAGIEIGSKIRYGVQLIANIGENEAKAFAFSDIKLSDDGNGLKVIAASLENNGDYLVQPIVNIQLFDKDGVKVKEINVPTKKIYPQNCQIFQLPVEEIPSGKYQAVLLAEYEEETIGINIELEL